ncbi:putative polyphosphate kinase [Helianthus anomalus]
MGPKRIFSDKIKNAIYDWSYNRGYIDAFYGTFFTAGVRKLAEFTHFFDRRIIDGIPNGVGFMSFFVAEVIKSVGVDAFLLICSFIFLMYQSFY